MTDSVQPSIAAKRATNETAASVVSVPSKRFDSFQMAPRGWLVRYSDGSREGPFATMSAAIRSCDKISERQIVEAYFGKFTS